MMNRDSGHGYLTLCDAQIAYAERVNREIMEESRENQEPNQTLDSTPASAAASQF